MNDWAISKAVQAAASVDGKVIRADAYPALGTIFLWRTVVETDGKWIVRRVHHFSTEPPANWPTQIVDKANHQWISKARQLEAVKTYDWFAGGRLRAQYEMQNGLHAVTFHDMRYGWPQESVESLWPLTVIFRRDGEVVHIGRERRRAREGFGELLSGVWRDIWNP